MASKGTFDELMKLINKYLRKNEEKGGVLKLLTREQIGNHPAIGIRFRNPINETQYSLANKGMSRERQYYLFKNYEDDIMKDIMKILQKIDDEGIKLGREQLKNLEYNVGILKMLKANNIKSADVLRKDGKNPSKVMKTQEKENFVGDTGILGSLQSKMDELVKLADEMKPENIAKNEAIEKAAREKMFKKKWHGRAYEGRSDQYRGLSYQLTKLHEAGIIKLDDEIYDALKEGKYHWAGADMFAPDPPRIWRYHFGDKIFDKLDEGLESMDDVFVGPTAMVDWMKANKIKPIKVDGPKNALDYMDEVELMAHADEAQESIDIFKSGDDFYSNLDMSDADKATNRMNSIVQNAENKKKYLDALKKNYPKAYEKYNKEPKNISEAMEQESYKVLSPGDPGYDEMMKKLGITAKVGDNLELESNVIQGPWKGSTKPLKGTVAETTEIIDISKMTNDDLNKLVDELNMNQGKMAEVDSTGGTKIGYEEFKKLEARNEAINKALADAKKVYEDLGDATGNFEYDYQLWLQARKKFFKTTPDTTAPGTYTITDHIEYIKTLEPIKAMKEANKMLQGTGRYKGISKADQDQIMQDTNDWIMQNDPSDKWDYKNNRPFREDPNFDPDDPDFDPEEFAKGGRVGYSGGGWGHGDSNIIDEEWDEGHDDMEGILKLLNQDQTAPQTIGSVGYQPVTNATPSDLDDLLERLRMVVEGLGIYSDYTQTQRKQMQRSLTNRINVLLGS